MGSGRMADEDRMDEWTLTVEAIRGLLGARLVSELSFFLSRGVPLRAGWLQSSIPIMEVTAISKAEEAVD